LLTLNSCATIFLGSNQKVYINSNPQGADVYINGVKNNQKTPFEVNISKKNPESSINRKNEVVYKFTKAGYNDIEIHDMSTVHWLIGLDFFCDLIPGFIDMGTKAHRKYNSNINANLSPLGNNDFSAPNITITNPKIQRGFKTSENSNSVLIQGNISDKYGISEVLLNDEKIKLSSNGDFSKSVSLNNGNNSFLVKATNIKNKSSIETFSIEHPNTNVVVENNDINIQGTGDRVALVIGNSSYSSAPLKNPVNDAILMGTQLKKLGFKVTVIKNGKKYQMRQAISDFGESLKKDKKTVGLFYYAGHGIQIKGENFLVPVDVKIEKEPDVDEFCVRLDYLMGNLEDAGNCMNIVILDACRNNPFGRGFRSQSGNGGLAQVNAPSGTLIAYATAPGSIAADGIGNNGLYTEQLVQVMSTPNLKLEDIFKKVRTKVKENSEGKQVPWESASLEGDFYFVK